MFLNKNKRLWLRDYNFFNFLFRWRHFQKKWIFQLWWKINFNQLWEMFKNSAPFTDEFADCIENLNYASRWSFRCVLINPLLLLALGMSPWIHTNLISTLSFDSISLIVLISFNIIQIENNEGFLKAKNI